VGETIVHPRGRTVSDEHMMWTNFVLNTAQLHFNQKMCDDQPQVTFDGRRVVYGGLVFAFVSGLASEETEENALAHLSYDEGRHLTPVFAGDTLFAESTVLAKTDDDPRLSAFGTPRETNQRFKYLLGQGQTGLSLALDLPTQLGIDADDPEAEGEVGKVGVSIGSLADMEELFTGIPLGKVSTSMTINATAPILLAMYEEAARKQGVADDRISGTVQNDLLKEFGARGAWLFPIEPSMRLACDLI